MLNSEETREKIIRLNPDVIIHTPLLRSKQTAEILRNILKETT
jgi:phosphohistidine phosphatase SixA